MPGSDVRWVFDPAPDQKIDYSKHAVGMLETEHNAMRETGKIKPQLN